MSESPAPITISGTMLTHPGSVRELNEDVVAYVLTPRSDDRECRLLALVADGMGGHAAGEVASALAAETVLRFYFEMEGSPPDVIERCLAAANKAIYEYAQANPDCAGMGTTCTVLAVHGTRAYLGHIGDSRAYMLRDCLLHQISTDHSLVGDLVRRGVLTAEEAARSPDRNIITRALGTKPTAEPKIWRPGLGIVSGDVFILCSDGLSDLVDDVAIKHTASTLDPFTACKTLRDQAMREGGHDNISIGIFRIDGETVEAKDAAATRPIAIADGIE